MFVNLLIFSVVSGAALSLPNDVPTATPVYAGMVLGNPDTEIRAPDRKIEAPAPDEKTPILSVDTDGLDMNWNTAMDTADPNIMRPAGIVLPFLESYPIDNIQVKLHLLNVRF